MKRNKTKAVALRYNGEDAPQVIAKGEGNIAKQIISSAKAHGIPLQQNEELTTLLSKVRINQEIPEALYNGVAQILAYLYFLNEKKE
jgi:flagellar biosynthesis protein